MGTTTPDEVKALLATVGDDVKAFITKQAGIIKELKDKDGELQARVLELEQQRARRGSGDPDAGAHDGGGAELRALLEDSVELKAVAERKSRRCIIELPPGVFQAKTIISGGGLAMPEHQPGLVAPVQRRFTIRALIPSIQTSAGSVQYTRETGFDNQAATVSETDLKPASNLTFELLSAAIVTVATWVKTSNQVLSDTLMLMAYIEGRLRYALALVEENQILKGSGSGNNLSGLLTSATSYSGSSGTMIDVLRRAAGQLEDTDYQPSGYVLHSADWRQIQMAKNEQGDYILGAPGGNNPPRLWGLPVVPTPAMTSSTFLVLDGPAAAVILDREAARVDISTETEDDFIRNMCRIRAEERIGLATLRAGALVKGTFGS